MLFCAEAGRFQWKREGARPCGTSESTNAIEVSNPSIFNGETFPDFIYSLVQRIKSGVKGSVVKVKDVPDNQKSENPVVGFHVDQHLLDPMTDQNNNVPQNVHRVPRSRK
jgi:hypothetical protein